MQMSEQQQHKEFQKQISHDTYMELLALEEQQLQLEQRLQQEKKNVMRQHLIRTIEDNKVKIQKKKDAITRAKDEERESMLKKQQEIELELQQQEQERGVKKQQMKEEMVRQLQAQKKKAEDQYELDRLAQVEADKQNELFDHKERFKKQARGQLVKESVMGNQEISQHHRWQQEHQQKQDQQVKENNNGIKQNFDNSVNVQKLEDKMHRKTLMNDLK